MPMSLRAMLIASPMPRVPPVTIATRAMRFLLLVAAARLGVGQPARKFALDQAFEHGDAFERIVEAVEQRELLTTSVDERLSPTDSKFLQRLEAIGGETGSGDRNPLDSPPGIAGEGRIGRGFQPLRAAETRLERHVDLAAERFRHQPRGLTAMAFIRIAEIDRPLRHSVKAEQQPLRLEGERGDLARDARPKRVDVKRVVEVRRQRTDGGLPAHSRK